VNLLFLPLSIFIAATLISESQPFVFKEPPKTVRIPVTMNATELSGKNVLSGRIEAIARKHRAVGLTVLGYAKGAVKFVKNYGYADIERKIPVTNNTVFYLASISKTITGVALMKLVDAGKIKSVDDDISLYLGYRVRNPHFPKVPITIKMLMTHTSSINDDAIDPSFWLDSSQANPPSIRQVLEPGGAYFNDDFWLNLSPGTRFAYSNFNAVVVASIIGRVSGIRFDEFVRSTLLRPLGIEGGYLLQSVPDINQVAVLYGIDEDGEPFPVDEDYRGSMPKLNNLSKFRPDTNPTIFKPYGGLRTNVTGLEHIMEAFLNGGEFRNGKRLVTMLRKKSVLNMLDTHWKGSGWDGLYKEKGLFIHITDDLVPGVRLYGHKGDVDGLLSGMYFDPKKKIGIIYIMTGGYHEKGESQFYTVEEDISRASYKFLAN